MNLPSYSTDSVRKLHWMNPWFLLLVLLFEGRLTEKRRETREEGALVSNTRLLLQNHLEISRTTNQTSYLTHSESLPRREYKSIEIATI